MIEAKLYYKFWWWKYYRTADGRTFSVREDFKKVFYHGNVKRSKKRIIPLILSATLKS